MDPIMASCQHIIFIEDRSECYHYTQEGNKVTDNIEVGLKTEVPPGEHYLHGARIINSNSSIMEAI
jgi:hypothetical protein